MEEGIKEMLKQDGLDIPGVSNDALMRIQMLLREMDTAIKAEREACARAVCKYCAGRDESVYAIPYRAGDDWVHLSVEQTSSGYANHWCSATPIRNRNKEVK